MCGNFRFVDGTKPINADKNNNNKGALFENVSPEVAKVTDWDLGPPLTNWLTHDTQSISFVVVVQRSRVLFNLGAFLTSIVGSFVVSFGAIWTYCIAYSKGRWEIGGRRLADCESSGCRYFCLILGTSVRLCVHSFGGQ